MFKMRTNSYINQSVEFFLPRSSPKGKGLYLSSSLMCHEYFKNGDEFHREVTIHFLFERPNNYTKVFYAVSEDMGVGLNDLNWIHSSNHDSCWIDDGVSSPLSKIYNNFLKDFRISFPDCRENPRIESCSLFHPPKFIDFEIKDNKDDVEAGIVPFEKRLEPLNIVNKRDIQVLGI